MVGPGRTRVLLPSAMRSTPGYSDNSRVWVATRSGFGWPEHDERLSLHPETGLHPGNATIGNISRMFLSRKLS